MIETAAGNILAADAEALVNTVNTVGVMGKGIALQFRQAFPENYRVYRAACLRGEVVPGQMLVVPTGRFDNPQFLINFPTKRHWKGKSRIEDIAAGLHDLVRVIQTNGIRSIAIPPLGCGNGGLDWAEVRPLIVRNLEPLSGTRVLLYEPEGAPRAEDMPVGTLSPRMTGGRAALVSIMVEYAGVGYELTLLEIQKLAYFLQQAGEPLRLPFVKGQYGPYAETLNHVLQRMEGHFIRGYGDRSHQANVQVLPLGEQEAAEFLRQSPATQNRLRRVAGLIEGFETPRGLELLATVDWVARENAALREDAAASFAAVQAWNDHKRQAFPVKQIETAWRQLRAQGWLGSGGS